MTMKALSLVLIFGAFLAGALLTVLDPQIVNWQLMGPALAVGVVGLWLHRKVTHGESRSDHKLSGNIDTLGRSLDNILANLEALDAREEDLPTYEARFEIDRLFRDDLSNFADARESMIHVFGMQNYADVMSNFAAGERYINRVWSASTDGYVDEVNLYLDRALEQFREAHAHFHELKDAHAKG
jgi:hypothetical protein